MNIRPLLRLIATRFFGDFCGFTEMCAQHIPSPVANADIKVQHIYTGPVAETLRGQDMVNCDQEGRLMVHTTKQYPTEDTTCFHVLGRVMSGTLYSGQQVEHRDLHYVKMLHVFLNPLRFDFSARTIPCSTRKTREFSRLDDFGYTKPDTK